MYPEYIAEQMAKARTAETSQERTECLANAIAANGLWLRALDIGYRPDKPYFPEIEKTSKGIRDSKAFQSLMADGNDKTLAEAGSVDLLVRSLKDKAEQLKDDEPDRPAIETIRDIQVKVQARTATRRDFAKLAAVQSLTARRKTVEGPDGEKKELVDRDITARVSGKALREETERVMQDADFQYLMEHEHMENLRLNALRLQGVGFARYGARASQLRELEAQRIQQAVPADAPPGKDGEAGQQETPESAPLV